MKSLRQRGAATDEMSRIVFLPGVGGDFLMLAAKEGCICAKSAHPPAAGHALTGSGRPR
jgi:hypothetical protein